MGLDTVELVMAIEEEFEIRIKDAEAPSLAVLGDMHAYVVERLRESGLAQDDEQVWQRLSAVVIEKLGVEPHEVKPSAHIVYDLHAD